jgi:hypothetical protein
MTLVFRRFDRVAMACAVLVLLVEVARAALGVRLTRVDAVRACAAVAAGALAVWQGVSLSPRIEALFLAGAVRGLGESGLELQALHRLAEAAGKLQTVFALAILGLHVVSVAAARPSRAAGSPGDSAAR